MLVVHGPEGEADTLLDAFSSARSFQGWTESLRRRIAMTRLPADHDFEPLPVSQPRTRLLRFDWEWHGLIDPFETPGPLA